MNKSFTTWADAISVYRNRSAITMIFLGFSAGLPLLLVFSTLSAWLRDYDVSRSAIGFFAWVGITYSIKVFWAPVIDHLPIPLLSKRLGKRKSWLFLAQLNIAIGLFIMAVASPSNGLMVIALASVMVAFSSATQDIVIDAYRIESADDELQGALAATYFLGYRVAMLVAGAGSLYIADITSWSMAYTVMGFLILALMFYALTIPEPPSTMLDGQLKPFTRKWFRHAVADPFVDFFKRNGKFALVLLALIGLYKLSDIVMGIMANPFYLDVGFSKSDIASISKLFGFAMTIIGSFVGGVIVVRYGVTRPLVVGAVGVAITNVLFVQLALVGPSITWLAVTISADNLFGGFAGATLLAFAASLTSRSYTATQAALFSSFMTLPGKFISGFSGVVVDAQGYAFFFAYAALLGIPAILVSIWVAKWHAKHIQAA